MKQLIATFVIIFSCMFLGSCNPIGIAEAQPRGNLRWNGPPITSGTLEVRQLSIGVKTCLVAQVPNGVAMRCW